MKHKESRSTCCHSESLFVTASSSAILYYPESSLSHAVVVMMSPPPSSQWYTSFQDTVVRPFLQDIILLYCLGLQSCVLKSNHCLSIAIYQLFRRMLLFYCFKASILVCWQTTRHSHIQQPDYPSHHVTLSQWCQIRLTSLCTMQALRHRSIAYGSHIGRNQCSCFCTWYAISP